MKKITISIILILVMILSVACSGTSNENASNGSSSTTTGSSGNFVLDYQPTKEKGFIVGFSNGYFGNTWRSQYVEGVEKVGEKYKELGIIDDLIIQNTNGVPEQIAAVESFINQGVDAIVLNPVSSSSLAPVVAKAINKGILVIISDNPAEYPNTINVIGDNGNFFKVQTKWLAEKIGKGNLVHITGVAGTSADQIRQDVAKEILADYPDIKILADAPGGWDQTKAQQVMSNFLSAYPQIDGVLMQDVMTQGVLQAYKAANRDLVPMTGDYTFGFFRTWKDQYPDAEMIGVPYAPGVGANSMEVAIHILMGDKLKDDVLVENPVNPEIKNSIISTVPYVVTKDGDSDAVWMKYEGLENTKAITLDEAIKLGEGLPDGASLDSQWSDEEVKALFK